MAGAKSPSFSPLATGGASLTNKTPRNKNHTLMKAGFLFLFLTGVYISQSPAKDDSDNSGKHLRSSSPAAFANQHGNAVLPNFRPIHEKCTTFYLLACSSSTYRLFLMRFSFSCPRYCLGCSVLHQGPPRIRGLYDARFGAQRTHLGCPRRRFYSHYWLLGTSRTIGCCSQGCLDSGLG